MLLFHKGSPLYIKPGPGLILFQIAGKGHKGGKGRQRRGFAAQDAGPKPHRRGPCGGEQGRLGGSEAALGPGDQGNALLPHTAPRSGTPPFS